jgi:hypothetical protein
LSEVSRTAPGMRLTTLASDIKEQKISRLGFFESTGIFYNSTAYQLIYNTYLAGVKSVPELFSSSLERSITSKE